MAELKYWELSDEFISNQLTRIHKIMENADKIEDIAKIQAIEIALLQEQRNRMKLMLDDETEAAKLSLEMAKNNNIEATEKVKFRVNTALKIIEILAAIGSTGAAVYSAKQNYKAKEIECASRERNVDRITRCEEDGNIPYQQANKSKYC